MCYNSKYLPISIEIISGNYLHAPFWNFWQAMLMIFSHAMLMICALQNNVARKYQKEKSLPKKNTMAKRKSFLENRIVRKTFQTKSLLYYLNNYYAIGSRVAYLSHLAFCGAGADERSLHFCHSSIAATPAIADFGWQRKHLLALKRIAMTAVYLNSPRTCGIKELWHNSGQQE